MKETEEKKKINYTTVRNCVHLVLDNELTLWGLSAHEYRLYSTTIIIYVVAARKQIRANFRLQESECPERLDNQCLQKQEKKMLEKLEILTKKVMVESVKLF